MKSTVEINYYRWTRSYEVHVYCTGTDYMIIQFWDEQYHPYEWQIQHIDENVPGDTTILNLTVLSEEELFQQSVVWDQPVDFYLVHAIQKHIIEHQPQWKGDTFYSVDLEY